AAGADATVVLPEYRYDGDTYKGVSLVQVAALHGHVEVVGPLVRAGAHLDHQTTDWHYKGSTALHLTVRHHDHPEMLRQLAALGLNVDTTNERGYTALHWAARWGRAGCVEALLQLDSPPNLDKRNNAGNTPLMVAKKKHAGECMRILISAGADASFNLNEFVK
ncbi:unnamed protein product, partial [Meganyctiphanes norvegica]